MQMLWQGPSGGHLQRIASLASPLRHRLHIVQEASAFTVCVELPGRQRRGLQMLTAQWPLPTIERLPRPDWRLALGPCCPLMPFSLFTSF